MQHCTSVGRALITLYRQQIQTWRSFRNGDEVRGYQAVQLPLNLACTSSSMTRQSCTWPTPPRLFCCATQHQMVAPQGESVACAGVAVCCCAGQAAPSLQHKWQINPCTHQLCHS
ncbi:uncharacterized protein LOC135096161 [Scylla paramamosain]|uniref:uncharacterized protein LOC135096161 n=1 Tax=Scylla paramamosain TaxID=85552 RepID=UPI003082D543